MSSVIYFILIIFPSKYMVNFYYGMCAIAYSIGLYVLSIYIAIRTLKEDNQFKYIKKLGIYWGSRGGTNFADADLTGANFSYSILRGCRFNKAKSLDRICFKCTKQLKYAQFANTIYENSSLLEL